MERRNAILTIAARSFLEYGYDRTSMSAIAAELGGSKGTLWSYFPSKEELFAAFLDEATAAFRQELIALLNPGKALKPTLETFTRRFIEKITAPESLRFNRLVTSENGCFPEMAKIFYERVPGASLTMLTTFLAEHMAAGRLAAGDARHAASMIQNLCFGYAQRALWGVKPPDNSVIAREAKPITDMFLTYFAPGSADANHAPSR